MANPTHINRPLNRLVKPCPFCGTAATVKQRPRELKGIYIFCNNGSCVNSIIGGAYWKSVVKKWNRRAYEN